MNCPKCRAKNAANATICKRCGEPLRVTQLTPTTSTTPTAIPATGITALFQPGKKFGNRYQILEQIGEGGMGKVFKALDQELDIVVVLKIINPELSSSPDMIARFKRELLLAREIVHENVVRIFDLGEIDGIRFISMNYIAGNSLHELLHMAGRLSLDRVMDISAQICQALQAAHAKGIVHRDLKPQNIMLDKKGRVSVLDFGIARSVEKMDITGMGIVIGTPDYMPPEQIQGERTDVQADFYSLGVMMYQMATGRMPFVANTPAEVLYKHLNENPPPPTDFNPHIPPELSRIILRCMKKKAQDRYRSADQILGDLQRIRDRRERKKSKQTAFWRRPIRNRPLKFGLRAVELVLALYLACSLFGLAVDGLYSLKLQGLLAEYEAVPARLAAATKEWLPEEWERRDCNAAEIYQRLLPPRELTVRIALGRWETWRLGTMMSWNNPAYLIPLQPVMTDLAKKLRLDELQTAVHCARLLPDAEELSYGAELEGICKLIFLQARANVGLGNFPAGLMAVLDGGYMLVDLNRISRRFDNFRAEVAGFDALFKELLPLVLSTSGDAASRELPKLEQLARLALDTVDSRIFFNRVYLDDVRMARESLANAFTVRNLNYWIWGKFKFWKDGFSQQRRFFRALRQERQERNRLMALPNLAKMAEYLYREERVGGPGYPFLFLARSRQVDALLRTRALAKLVIIAIRMQQFGLQSIEFANLRHTEVWINDLDGQPFRVSSPKEGQLEVYRRAADKFVLRPINYQTDLKRLLLELGRW